MLSVALFIPSREGKAAPEGPAIENGMAGSSWNVFAYYPYDIGTILVILFSSW